MPYGTKCYMKLNIWPNFVSDLNKKISLTVLHLYPENLVQSTICQFIEFQVAQRNTKNWLTSWQENTLDDTGKLNLREVLKQLWLYYMYFQNFFFFIKELKPTLVKQCDSMHANFFVEIRSLSLLLFYCLIFRPFLAFGKYFFTYIAFYHSWHFKVFYC